MIFDPIDQGVDIPLTFLYTGLMESGKEFEMTKAKPEVTQESLKAKHIYVDYNTSTWWTDYEVMKFAYSQKMCGPLVAVTELPNTCTTVHLFELDEWDKKWIGDVPLKAGEQIFRFGSVSTVAGSMMPLVKINVLRNLVYFLTEESFDGIIDEVEFKKKGVKVNYLRMTFEVATKHGVI